MNKSRKVNTILIPLESYLFLQDRQSLERLGKHKSEKMIEKLKQNFAQFQHDGFYQVMDGDFGDAMESLKMHGKKEDGLLGLVRI